MASHPIDSELFRDQFGTEEMRQVFSDASIIQKWLNVEAALAVAQAELNIIPESAAEEICKKASVEMLDFTVIREGMKASSHPLITVIKSLEELCEEDASRYIHWGATTQDIIDTGLVLQIKEAREQLLKQTNVILDTLLSLAQQYKNTLMPGRTHGQHALPITFGYKVAIWVDEIGRHISRLEESEQRILTGQFGGAAGTLASLEDMAFPVQEKMLASLGLQSPTITWHVARDNFAEFAMNIGMIAATLEKISNEIINMQRTELAELEEGFVDGKVGSSTMPHKRNPMICEYVVGICKVARKQVALALDCMVQEHERDMALWQVEWAYIPEICILTSGALAQMQTVIEGLIVNEANMRKNVGITRGLIVSEKVMLGLAQYVGRQKAHDLVYHVSMRAFEKDKSLEEVLLSYPEILRHMSKEEVLSLIQPENYLGQCISFVDRVAKKWQKKQINHEQVSSREGDNDD
ncbi:adenylosuccinate lyase [Cytobacillus purgationiresistens]|uniref:3-carboxy-cis,cis-muconate cycloisomerase n=1 Tax=Cytobacillus purgationiresistens TaxID=863449 RepID=A0ABU0AQQ9_9BACI|nr:adenylosuccinate lyase [Cytobacillus purgationiresistens]MDQ0272360.1 3-carboxy-cis,cis-muconate cycloisomerase [Cytobacillus purgationiresistens]